MKDNIKFNGKYGYTLVELLVVLALFAIVLSISLPSMRSFFSIMEKKELLEFKRDLASARNSAIINSKTYTFAIVPSDNQYYISEQGTDTKIIKEVNLSSGLRIKGSNTGNHIKFTSSGAPAGGGSFWLIDPKGREIKITISPATGKVNIYKEK